MPTTLDESPEFLIEGSDEFTLQAKALRCAIIEAMVRLDGFKPHAQRTRLGRHLLTAISISDAWIDDGNMDTSKGVHPR